MIVVLVLLVCVFSLIFIRLWNGKSKSSTCLIGKTALITGANSGIGYQTTLNLASRGCRIIMADVSDMKISKENIIKFTNNSNIVTKNLDLASFKSVREFAQDILQTEQKLDILINNAGIGTSALEHTQDGLNPTMQINYLGHFLLTHLLAPLLKKSAPARIVFTSSLLAFFNNLRVDNINYNSEEEMNWFDGYQNFNVYGNSKLATIIASDIFGEKLKSYGVTSNSLHPGAVVSPIYKKFFTVINNRLLKMFITFVITFLSKDIWEGSQTLLHLAVSKQLDGVTGKHFWECKPFFKPLSAYNKKFCNEIWRRSEELVGLKENEKL